MTEDNKNNEYSNDLQDAKKISKHSVKVKQKERNIRKQRKKQNRLKTFLRIILFVLLLFFIYEFVTLPQWYLKPEAFSTTGRP